MQKLLFFLAVALMTVSALGQQAKIDSLKNELKTEKRKEQRLELLYQLCNMVLTTDVSNEHKKELQEQVALARELKNTTYLTSAYQNFSTYHALRSERDLAIAKILKAGHLADSLKDYLTLQQCLMQEGFLREEKNEKDKAKKLLLKAVQVVEEHNLPENIKANSHSVIAVFSQRNGDDENAIKHYVIALKMFKNNPPDLHSLDGYLYCFYGLSQLYADRKQYKKATKYASNGLEELEKLDCPNKWYFTVIYHRMLGTIYMEKKQYEKAIQEFLVIWKNKDKNSVQFNFDVNIQLADCYISTNKYNKALKFSTKAIEIAEKIQDSLCLTSAYTVKANIFNKLGKPSIAKKTLQKIAKNITQQPVHIQKAFYNSQIETCKLNKNYKQALQNLILLSKLKDSMNRQLLDSKVAELETKYQTEKKEKENLQLKEDKAQQKLLLEKENQQKWILFAILVGTIWVLVIFAFYYKRNKKQKELIERLQRELHHRIKNNLAVIDSLVEDIKQDMGKGGNVAQRLTDLQNRILSINEIHLQLYRSADITNLSLQQYVAILTTNIANSFAKPNIEVQQEIPQRLNMETEKLFPIGMIINEFVTNSYKYAFTPDKHGIVRIIVKETPKEYQLHLADNGKGLPKDFTITKLTSFGMEVIQLLSKQLQGTFELNGTNGVQIIIKFPKN